MLATGNVMAVPSGSTVEFASSMGKVTFSGKAHADKGLQCADCHSKPKLGEMKKGGDKITMAAINESKFCGTCHGGKKAFSVKVAANCVKCHQTDSAATKANAKAPLQTAAAGQSAEINIETAKGTVQFSGFVRSRADINKAVEVAKSVDGVKSVRNDMILK